MTAFLLAVIPVASIILIGVIAGRTLTLDPQTLSQVSVYILAPALVADGLYRTTLSVNSAAGLLIGCFVISLLLYFAILGLNKLLDLPPNIQKSLLATTLFSNNGNLGLPLIAFTLGQEGLERAIIYMIGSSILMFGIAPALLKGESFIYGIKMTLKLPLIWAMLGGSILKLCNIKLPIALDQGMQELGRSAIPLALILLGIQLCGTHLYVGKYELFATAIRLLFAPIVAYIVGHILELKGLDFQVLILQSSMPAAVNTVVLVTEFGGDPPRVARTIVVTTLLSFLTLPLVLWLSK